MPAAREIPPELIHGGFRPDRALEFGITASQLRGQRFRSPFHGVHAVEPGSDLLAQCAAAALVLPPDAAFSDSTAARLVDLPAPHEDRLHVTRPGPIQVRRRGLRGHVRQRDDSEIWLTGGVRFVAPRLTFFDLAEQCSRFAVVGYLDALLRSGLADRDWLDAEVVKRAGRRGNDVARAALACANERSESPMESALRVLLLDAGLSEFEVNVNLYDAFGTFIARADLFSRAARLLVEFDGDQHRTDRLQFARDLRRTTALNAAGFVLLRFTASDVFQYPEATIATVATALRRYRTP